MRETPILYSHQELLLPAKPVEQKSVQAKPVNPYQYAMYQCGESLL